MSKATADHITRPTRRAFLGGSATVAAAATIPAIAFPGLTADDAELFAAYQDVVAAYEAFNGIEDDDTFDQRSDRWMNAQDRLLEIRATTVQGVALKLRFALAIHDGWFPRQGFYNEPATMEAFKSNMDAYIVYEAIGVLERMA